LTSYLVKNKKTILFVVISVVLLVQGVAINRPFFGNFASYQVSMMELAKNMALDHEWFYPKLSYVVAGKKALHLNQYPLPSAILAVTQNLLPISYEFWGHFQMILFHVLSLFFFYRITRKVWGEGTAILAVTVYAWSPYTLIYGQSFMCESPGVFFFLCSLFLILNVKGDTLTTARLVLAGFLFSISILNRIHYVLMMPVFYCVLYYKPQKRWIHLIFFSLISIALPALWYSFVYQTAQNSDNVQMHLFMQLNAGKIVTGSLLLGLPYYQYMLDLFSTKMLTPLLFPFLFVGFLALKEKKPMPLIWAWILSLVLLVVMLPRKNFDHEFYFYPFILVVFQLTAAGLLYFFDHLTRKGLRNILIFSGLIFLCISARYFLHPLYKYPASDQIVLKAAEYVKSQVPPDAKIIAADGGRIPFLYYSDRLGWPFNETGQGPLPNYWRKDTLRPTAEEELKAKQQAYKSSIGWLEYLRERGASYFVVANARALRENEALFSHLTKRYSLINLATDSFYLFDLQKK
jgi:hypothetical protein